MQPMLDTSHLPRVPEWKKPEISKIFFTRNQKKGLPKLRLIRPQVRNAFRPLTVREMETALADARDDENIGVIILTGQGKMPSAPEETRSSRQRRLCRRRRRSASERFGFQRQIRTCPKPVIAMVAGWCVGGGHVLHMMCDLTIAADNARFGQTGPRVGSFDGGWGASYMARIVGQKKAREIWFLCRFYDATEALEMGLVNTVVPYEELEAETVQWCREILANSPIAIRCLKAALNADCDARSVCRNWQAMPRSCTT